jgi:REJ domain
VDTAKSILTIPANNMSIAEKYAYTVMVTSNGRSVSKTVNVVPQATGAELSIISPFTRFDPASRLIVNGFLSSSVALSTVWTVTTALGAVVPFSALTTASKTFSALDAQNKIRFPLCVGPSTFQGGSAYLFRLTVTPVNSTSKASFAEITLTANAAPTGGYVTTTPAFGGALVTSFLIASPGWTADASAFPLSYSFAYQLAEGASYFTIAASSLRAFTSTTLPAGGSTVKSTVTLQSQATDIFKSSALAYGTVVVTQQVSTNVTQVLISGLLDAFSSGNINRAFQTVNNVSYGIAS